MSEQQELQAKTAIVHAMRPQERLASFYRSRKSKSMYLILANDAGDYLPIRISNHRAFSGFLSVPTFELFPATRLETDIRAYLATADWIPFTYQDFFVLSLVKYGHHRGSMIQIDDSYLTFSEETQAIAFYQVVRSHKQIVMNGLSVKMNQVLGKLYATDLIGSFTKDGLLLVYLTEGGRRLLDLSANKHMDQFIQDYATLNWRVLDVPSNTSED